MDKIPATIESTKTPLNIVSKSGDDIQRTVKTSENLVRLMANSGTGKSDFKLNAKGFVLQKMPGSDIYIKTGCIKSGPNQSLPSTNTNQSFIIGELPPNQVGMKVIASKPLHLNQFKIPNTTTIPNKTIQSINPGSSPRTLVIKRVPNSTFGLSPRPIKIKATTITDGKMAIPSHSSFISNASTDVAITLSIDNNNKMLQIPSETTVLSESGKLEGNAPNSIPPVVKVISSSSVGSVSVGKSVEVASDESNKSQQVLPTSKLTLSQNISGSNMVFIKMVGGNRIKYKAIVKKPMSNSGTATDIKTYPIGKHLILKSMGSNIPQSAIIRNIVPSVSTASSSTTSPNNGTVVETIKQSSESVIVDNVSEINENVKETIENILPPSDEINLPKAVEEVVATTPKLDSSVDSPKLMTIESESESSTDKHLPITDKINEVQKDDTVRIDNQTSTNDQPVKPEDVKLPDGKNNDVKDKPQTNNDEKPPSKLESILSKRNYNWNAAWSNVKLKPKETSDGIIEKLKVINSKNTLRQYGSFEGKQRLGLLQRAMIDITPKQSDSFKNHTTIDITNNTVSDPNGPIKVLQQFSPIPQQAAVQTINIFNGQLSNPTDAIKVLNSSGPPSSGSPVDKLAGAGSPSRLSGRSKSLTTSEPKQPDSDCEIVELQLSPRRAPSEPIQSRKRKMSGEKREEINSLVCNENMEESDTSKSSSPGAQQGISTDTVTKPATTETVTNVVPTAPKQNKIIEITTESNKMGRHPFSAIKWEENGVGWLGKRLKFCINEFGFVSVKRPEQNSVGKSVKQEPHSYSEFKLYTCKICDGKSVNKICHKCNRNTHNQPIPTDYTTTPFLWSSYLRRTNGIAAPINLFLNPFPSSRNAFQVNMKLEAIDPQNASLFCVCTIVEKMGYRIKLRFDGYGAEYDFWRNADSMDIFPLGFCSKTGRTLQSPRNYANEDFDWNRYLKSTKTVAAYRMLFTHLNAPSTDRNPFKVGMKMEACDLKHSRKICVASVADVIDNRILVTFDGWDDSYNYWTDITSPYIHPINWHIGMKNGASLTTPPDLDYSFTWSAYLKKTGGEAAPVSAFVTRDPIPFKAGMKLEVVDKKNPSLIRPATILMVDNYQIKLLFDGWHVSYSYWLDDDSTDIHPIDWCHRTGHPLTPPMSSAAITKNTCGVIGCQEVGNALKPNLKYHYTLNECPYEAKNWNSETTVNRLAKEKELNVLEQLTKRPSLDSLTFNSARKRKRNLAPTTEPSETMKVPPIIPTVSSKTTRKLTDFEKRLQVSFQYLQDYGPSIEQLHMMWKRNSFSIKPTDKQIKKGVLKWTVEDVSNYVDRIPKCIGIGEILKEEDIDGEAFLCLTKEDLTNNLNLKRGPAIKIYNQILLLREEISAKYDD